MKKEIADLWTKALRSGKYKQATGCLKDQNGHMCCLGVLSDLMPSGEWIGPYKMNFKDGNSLEPFHLTKEVLSWSGVKEYNGQYKTELEPNCLAELNDEGYTFEKIATVIEENWETL